MIYKTLVPFLLFSAFQMSYTLVVPNSNGNTSLESLETVSDIESNEIEPKHHHHHHHKKTTTKSPDFSFLNIMEHYIYSMFEKETVSEIDDRVEYFRLDFGINLFHFVWHEANPFEGILIHNHRRGELFYYMHQQMLARYNIERIANGDDPIKSKAKEVMKKGTKIELEYNLPGFDTVSFDKMCNETYRDLQYWTENIVEAIKNGYAETYDGYEIPLSVDLLGNMIQPTRISPDRDSYGAPHNMWHYSIAYCHYMDRETLTIPVLEDLGEPRTASRSTVLYRFHTYINDLFQIYFKTLPTYEKEDLEFPGIKVNNIKLVTESGNINEIETFWQELIIDELYKKEYLTRQFERSTHIQRENFHYEITVTNENIEPKNGTVRIFLAPKYDVNGRPLKLSDQRDLFIELDKFPVELQIGSNTFNRSASDSIVTVPSDILFRSFSKGRKFASWEGRDFCLCGWPDHFLLPRGTEEGMIFQLFVMISDYDNDSPDDIALDFDPPNPNAKVDQTCKVAYSYCGKMESVYPDSAPMGYPWDKLSPKWASTLDDFLTPNMLHKEIIIKHLPNKIIEPIEDVNRFGKPISSSEEDEDDEEDDDDDRLPFIVIDPKEGPLDFFDERNDFTTIKTPFDFFDEKNDFTTPNSKNINEENTETGTEIP